MHRGRPFLLRAHLDRLARSLGGNPARAIRIRTSNGPSIVGELVSRAGAPEQLVYLQVTRGAECGRNHPFPAGVAPTVFGFTAVPRALARAARDRASRRSRARTSAGRAATSSRSRCSPTCCCGRRPATTAPPRRSCVREGWLTEGSSSTVFVVLGRAPARRRRTIRESCRARRAKPCSSSPGGLAQEIRPVAAGGTRPRGRSLDRLGRSRRAAGHAARRPPGRQRPTRAALAARPTPRCRRHLDALGLDDRHCERRRPTLAARRIRPHLPADHERHHAASSSRPISRSRSWARPTRTSAASCSASCRSISASIDAERIEERPSSAGRYLGITVTVRAESREQLDAVYRDLTSCQRVLVAL